MQIFKKVDYYIKCERNEPIRKIANNKKEGFDRLQIQFA